MPDIRVLFVCLGNICRSPVAEVMFRSRAAEAGLDVEVESAGTGDWHIGSPAQPGSLKVGRANGLDLSKCRARQIAADDFRRFTHIIAMDETNLSDLEDMAPEGHGARVERLLFFSDLADTGVLDPYQQGDEAFERMYTQIEAGIDGLIAELKQVH